MCKADIVPTNNDMPDIARQAAKLGKTLSERLKIGLLSSNCSWNCGLLQCRLNQKTVDYSNFRKISIFFFEFATIRFAAIAAVPTAVAMVGATGFATSPTA